MIRDMNKYVTNALYAREDLIDAKNRRQKGNYPGFAGYRQRGRAEARAAKRHHARAHRRIDKLLCQVS